MDPYKEIILNNKIVKPRKSIISPIMDSKNILVNDTWEYVSMWLKKNNQKEALFFWEQSKSFFNATQSLPNTSSPLTSYYCFLNATKTLLKVKNINFAEKHGVTGKRNGKLSLNNEKILFKTSGILPALQSYFNEVPENEEYTMKQLLQNLVFIHRVYNLTYSSSSDLFIPLKDVKFLRATKKRQGRNHYEFCLSAEFDTDIVNGRTINSLPRGFEYKDNLIISDKKFKWRIGLNDKNSRNKTTLEDANKHFRKNIVYIKGLETHWYLKKDNKDSILDKSMPIITFAIMHRLSELSRYSPDILAKYLESKHNWLLAEFLNTSVHHFIDQLSSEITGYDFVIGKNLMKS